MNIVCNSSPLIFLSKIGRSKALFELFDKVYIPKAVYNEILISGKNDICAKEVTEGISSGKIIQRTEPVSCEGAFRSTSYWRS